MKTAMTLAQQLAINLIEKLMLAHLQSGGVLSRIMVNSQTLGIVTFQLVRSGVHGNLRLF